MSILHNKNDENYIYYLVAHNLKSIRKKKGFTQAKFAELCNYSEGFIMNIESVVLSYYTFIFLCFGGKNDNKG